MKALKTLVFRNCKLFFKDKSMFLTSVIAPLILLVLYATFLGDVYRDSFLSILPEDVTVSETLVNGFVGSELFSSILAVCCITVALCSNLLMVQDKVSGVRNDLTVAPVKPVIVSVGYYISTVITTLAICFVAALACLIYVKNVGWYMSIADVLLSCVDIFMLSHFGTAVSSIIVTFIKTEGQMSVVCTIISAVYGFICGAYMPIAQFGLGLRRIISFLPSTYGTALLRNHALTGVFEELETNGVIPVIIEKIKDSVDCNIYFFGKCVNIETMYLVFAVTLVIAVGVAVLLNVVRERRSKQ